MNIQEMVYFVRQIRGGGFGVIGAVLPTSGAAARAMQAEALRRPGARMILEVGAGTGAITAEIVQHLRPDDYLVVCEINRQFLAYLRGRFEREAAFQRVAHQVTFYEGDIVAFGEPGTFDAIISAIPLNNCTPSQIAAIFEHYRQLLKPGGTLTYIEYAYLRAFKQQIAMMMGKGLEDQIVRQEMLQQIIDAYQFRRDTVWCNLPPAWVRHLRFSAPPLDDLPNLVARAPHDRVGAGWVAVDRDAVLPAGVLTLLSLGLWRIGIRYWSVPLLLAGGLAWFLRDPPRMVVADPDVIYAASDGRVLSVERIHDPRFGETTWKRVAVFLSLANVHLVRAPIAGRVVHVLRQDGGFAAAFHPNAESNVAEYHVLEGIHGRCILAQRVGLLARRIVSRMGVGALVAQGERMGLIRFGSRTDIYLPEEQVDVCVAPGDHVRAGQTVIARYRP